MRRVAVSVVAAVVVAACGGDDAGEPPSAAAPASTSETSTATTAEPTTSSSVATTTTTTTAATATTRAPTTTAAPSEWPPSDLPLLTVVNPADHFITADPVVTVIGVSPPGSSVMVGETQVDVGPDGVEWRVDVALEPGEHTVPVAVTNAGERSETTLFITYDPGLEVGFGRLHGIGRGDPGWTLMLDAAVLLTGEEAEEYLGEEPVDGYWIVDDEPDVIEGFVAAADVVMVMWEGQADVPWMAMVRATAGEVMAAFQGAGDHDWWMVPDPFPVECYLQDGLVVQVVQRWFP